MIRNEGLAQGYAALVGIVLVAIGLLGFVPNPLVGGPEGDPIFITGLPHDLVHVGTGALALFIAFGLSGEAEANGVIGFGVLYAVIFVALLASPDLFGILQHDVNVADQVLHGALFLASVAVGWMARGPGTATALRE